MEIFYLKVNRPDRYTLRNLKTWLQAVELFDEYQIHIVCDNEELTNRFSDELREYVEKPNVDIITSSYAEPIKIIVDQVVNNDRWNAAGYAHLTTFYHAYLTGYDNFWNIDADDTRICLDVLRIKETLDVVKDYADNHNISLFSLDMWASFFGTGKHWTLGITYTRDTKEAWDMINAHYDDETYPGRNQNSNIDNYFRWLKSEKGYSIESFYFENLRFIHYSDDFFHRVFQSGLSHWKNGFLHYPIIENCFGIEEAGSVPIDPNVVRLDIGITDKETGIAMAEASNALHVINERIEKYEKR